jgi:hypothetical protein
MAGAQWIPTTEDELRAALSGCVLVESHYVDFKALIASGDKANLGIAIDLASFAVDSGIIVVGVDESTDPPTFAPVALTGLKERVDQIGRSRVDPPLLVVCAEIPAAGRPGEGCLVIAVPASPMAPHMVDSIYRGRGDTTNIRLSDAEVRRIRDQRRQGEFDILAILRDEITRDPIAGETRQNGHLFVVAEPVFADAEMLLSVAGDKWREWLHGSFRNGAPRLTADWAPDITSAVRVVRGARGWAMRSWDGERSNAAKDREDGTIELEVHENGGIRLYSARATDVLRGDVVVFVDPLIFGLVWRVVDWARTIAGQTGFVGNWRFAVGLTRVGGARSLVVAQRGFLSQGTPFDADEHEEWTEATFAELTGEPDRVVERLVGRLNRALSDGTVPLPKRA